MNRPVPPIHESADDLKQLLGRERHPHKRQRFDSLAVLRDELVRLVRAYDHAMFQSLTRYPYIMDAINALSAWLIGVRWRGGSAGA